MLKSTLTEPCLFFHLFLQSKMSFKLSHCFARISEDTNCDQRCTGMANVEEFDICHVFWVHSDVRKLTEF